MNNIKRFSSRKEVTKFLKEKGIDTSNWSEEKWLSLNKGQAEIHLMDLAEKIYDAMIESTPKQLNPGEYHIPFENKLKDPLIWKLLPEGIPQPEWAKLYWETKVKISTAMAARTSYTVVADEKEIDYSKMIDLHDRLISQNPPHSSPMEHCARAMTMEEYESHVRGTIEWSGGQYDKQLATDGTEGWCRNFKGFIPYRHIVENN